MQKRADRKTKLPIPKRRRKPTARQIPLKDLCWRDLVRKACKSEPAFNVLLSRLGPLIAVIVYQHARNIREDASQAARLKLWQALKSINTNRPNLAIRRALTKVIRNAVISERRLWSRQVRHLQYTADDLSDRLIKDMPVTTDNGRAELKTHLFHIKIAVDDKHLIGKCQAFMRKHGTTQAMMFAVSKQVGRRRPISYLRRLLTIDNRIRPMPLIVKRLLAAKRPRKRKV